MKKKSVVHAIHHLNSNYAEANLCDYRLEGHSIRGCYAGSCHYSRHHRVTCKNCLKKLQKKKEKKS
jgi:hypothetical protein